MRLLYAVFATALLQLLLYHLPLYRFVSSHLADTSSTLQIYGVVTIAQLTVTIVLFSLIALGGRRFFRIVMSIFFVGNALALYFVLEYHVLLDKSMMGNLFNTNYEESSAYLSMKMLYFVLPLGLLPIWLLWKIPLYRSSRKSLIINAFSVLIVGVLIMYLNASTWLWIDKYAKRLGALSMPWSYTINAVRYQLKEMQKNRKLKPLPRATVGNGTPQVVVLIIGESARKDHFSIYGYNRKTNPELSAIPNIIALDARSAATYTTASVSAMLSSKGDTSDIYEPLPTYLMRAGVDVIWRANNWGSPTLKANEYLKASDLRKDCLGKECDYDGVLLTGLRERIMHATSSKVLVILHTAGSHGPNYTRKYPSNFEVFSPVCRSVDLKSCSNTSLVNAYDNTIRYTDHFIASTIRLLQTIKRSSLLIYVSDHGESLGEYGLYLHGTPYTIAPIYQKEIPLILWASEPQRVHDINRTHTYTHRDIFHTVLGALNIQSPVYDPRHDILRKTTK